MRFAIAGAGLAGMATAIHLVDAGHEVEIFESRPFVGGKVGSWVDKDGNHMWKWGYTFSLAVITIYLT
jgi:zeta-carotene desaturase